MTQPTNHSKRNKDMKREQELYFEICEREKEEIKLSDMRPKWNGNTTFKRMNLSQMKYYLMHTENTKRKKKELRKLVGFWHYYFHYVPKFTKNFNSYYYHRI